MWLVPYFGGQYLDPDSDFGRYRHFCGTFIDMRAHRNPNKRGTQNN